MKLFGTPGSPFARKVRVFIEEKRIPHEYIVERGSAPGSRVPQFNPLGKVPTLADIAAGYALDYLDFALPDVEWRKAHPALARLAERLFTRKSFAVTAHARN